MSGGLVIRWRTAQGMPALLEGIREAGWNMKDASEPVFVFGYIGDRAIWSIRGSSGGDVRMATR